MLAQERCTSMQPPPYPQYPPQQQSYPSQPPQYPYMPSPSPSPAKASQPSAFLRSLVLGLLIGVAVFVPIAGIGFFVAVRSGAVRLPASISVPFFQPAPDGYLYQDSADVAFITFDQTPQDGPLSGTLYTVT